MPFSNLGLLVVVAILLSIGSTQILPPPVERVGAYFNDAFPSKTPGAVGAWEVYDFVEDNIIASPLKIISAPDSNEVYILSKLGELWRMDLSTKTQELILDIKDRSFKLGEAGTVGLALHPKFGIDEKHNYILIFYRHKPEPDRWSELGFNRLSKFYYDENTRTFDPDSEEILIQHYDRSTWHNGGGMFFGNDGFLYLGLGDEGNPDEVDIYESTQNIDKGLFGGLLRIDVDNDTSRSHSIRRQPLALDDPPAGWGDTYTKGYSIPNDNPWLDASGDILEEFFAIGIRQPYSLFYDRLTDEIWGADVGSNKFEEINIIGREDNLQWPYIEGEMVSDRFDKPDSIIGNEKPPVYYYPRSVGTTVICGGIYRGKPFPQLNNRLLFADYTANKLLALHEDRSDADVIIEDINSFGIDIPDESGIGAVNILDNGMILISVLSRDFFIPGKILALRNKEQIPDPPARLSELGVFEDMASRKPAVGFIPYDVNVPLWSDRALKSRYIAIPNDGILDSQSEQITFDRSEPWDFPEGTVILKQFDLPVDLQDSTKTIPLESRFFVIGEDNSVYGLTYKWDSSGTEAYLQLGSSTEEFDIYENGNIAFTQKWEFPSRSNCMTCHNAKAGFVLGVNTHQLNRDHYYPEQGRNMNQLDYLNSVGAFRQGISSADNYPRGFSLTEKNVSLDIRIRSYWDANCSSCHRKGGSVGTTDMDLRLSQPLLGQNVVGHKSKSLASTNEFIVKPGQHQESELWVRDQSTEQNRMPPLATNIVDQMYVDSLAKWIDQISLPQIDSSEVLLAPNPAQDYIQVIIGGSKIEDLELELYSTSGELAYTRTLKENHTVLDLSFLPSGTYIVKVHGAEIDEIMTIIIL